MKEKSLTEQILFIIRLISDIVSRGKEQGQVLANIRYDEAKKTANLVDSPELSEGFRRLLREHQIYSNILRDSLSAYLNSLDSLEKNIEEEFLGDGRNLYIGHPPQVEEDQIPPADFERPAGHLRRHRDLGF